MGLTVVKMCCMINVQSNNIGLKTAKKEQIMPKFMLGNVAHQLDDKLRMRIPAKYRESIGASSYIVPGRKGCLYIIPEAVFSSVLQTLGNDQLYGNDEKSDIGTDILGNGDYLEEDAQGRVKLSKELRETAGIKKEIVFVGKGTYLEVWPKETWEARFSVLNPDNLNRMLENLKKFGV